MKNSGFKAIVLCLLFFAICFFMQLNSCFAEDIKGNLKVGDLTSVVKGAIGPFNKYCDGYGNPGSSGLGYICAMALNIGIVKQDMDKVLEGIVAYDRAETQGEAYFGQINMIAASSFCGLNGALWGYDLAKNEDIASNKVKPLFEVQRHDGKKIPVYSADPLLDSAARLFGSNNQRRFPLLPGAQVICATKEYVATGPKHIWSAIAISIAENRTKDSCLFVEDAGEIAVENPDGLEKFGDELRRKIAKCAIRCGKDNNALYKEIWISYRIKWIPEGQVGCALVAAPYLVLAKDALPDNDPQKLLNMTISEWETKVLSLTEDTDLD